MIEQKNKIVTSDEIQKLPKQLKVDLDQQWEYCDLTNNFVPKGWRNDLSIRAQFPEFEKDLIQDPLIKELPESRSQGDIFCSPVIMRIKNR